MPDILILSSGCESSKHLPISVGVDIMDGIMLQYGAEWSMNGGIYTAAIPRKCEGSAFFVKSHRQLCLGVLAASHAYKYGLTGSDIVVIASNIDLEIGRIRFKHGRKKAPKKGDKHREMNSVANYLIDAKMGGSDFWRLRIGVNACKQTSSSSLSMQELLSIIMTPWPENALDKVSDSKANAMSILSIAIDEGLEAAESYCFTHFGK